MKLEISYDTQYDRNIIPALPDMRRVVLIGDDTVSLVVVERRESVYTNWNGTFSYVDAVLQSVNIVKSASEIAAEEAVKKAEESLNAAKKSLDKIRKGGK